MEKCLTCLQEKNFCTCIGSEKKHLEHRQFILAQERGTKLPLTVPASSPEVKEPSVEIAQEVEQPKQEEKNFFKRSKKSKK